MTNDEIKLKFINLRLNSVPLRRVADILGISLATALRWNKKFSDEIMTIKSQKECAVNNHIDSKIEKYLSVFEKYFKMVEDEIDNYKDCPMPFETALNQSVKIFKTIQQLISMKKISANAAFGDDLNLGFLKSIGKDDNNNNDDNDDKDDYRNDDTTIEINQEKSDT